jgi:hypothetical protein
VRGYAENAEIVKASNREALKRRGLREGMREFF